MTDDHETPPVPQQGASDGDFSTTGLTTIMVNGRVHRIAETVMAGTQLARLAYPDIDVDGARSLTIAYSDGPVGASAGLLSSGRSTPIANGQSFHAYLTDKS